MNTVEKLFTPGPWRAGREDMQSYNGETGEPFTNIYVDDPRGGTHPVFGTTLPYTVARAFGDAGDENKANARLIAAAPDLLDALMRLERIAVTMSEQLGYTPDRVPTIEGARAAIAKVVECQS